MHIEKRRERKRMRETKTVAETKAVAETEAWIEKGAGAWSHRAGGEAARRKRRDRRRGKVRDTRVSNASQPSGTSAIPDRHQASAAEDASVAEECVDERARRVDEWAPSATTRIEHCGQVKSTVQIRFRSNHLYSCWMRSSESEIRRFVGLRRHLPECMTFARTNIKYVYVIGVAHGFPSTVLKGEQNTVAAVRCRHYRRVKHELHITLALDRH